MRAVVKVASHGSNKVITAAQVVHFYYCCCYHCHYHCHCGPARCYFAQKEAQHSEGQPYCASVHLSKQHEFVGSIV